MLTILAFWIFILSIVVPCGSFFADLYNKLSKENKYYSFFDTFWLGLCFLSIIVVILSLVFPINIYMLSCMFFCTTLYTFLNKRCRNIYKKLFLEIKNLSYFSLITVFLTLIVILMFSCAPPNSYDMELYHLQSMIWSNEYSVVPGLANIHGRLAFNPSSILLSTLFSYHPQFFSLFFPLNGLCMCVLAMFLITKTRLIKDIIKQTVIIVTLFFILFIFRAIFSSTSTDILPAIVIIYLIYRFLLDEKKENELIYFALPLFCCTLKLSTIPIAILSLFVLVACFKRKEWRKIFILGTIACLIIIPWCARYIILSGYLIYPFSKIDIFSFDWKVPIKEAVREEQTTYAWARIPGRSYQDVSNMSLSDWVPIWFNAKYNTIKYLIYLTILSPLVILLSLFNFRKNINLIFIWLVAVLGLVFNFITAPDIRFSLGFLITVAFLPYYSFSLNFEKKIFNFYHKIFICCMMSCFVLIQYQEYGSKSDLIKPSTLDYSTNDVIFDFYYLDTIKIYKPTKGDRCFDYCIPCMPYLNKGLELRGKSLQEGFRTNELLE